MGKLRILSYSGEPFADRREAGALLAGELSHLQDGNTVVLGIPRGGIVVADELAMRLGVELDIVLARKLGAPHNPELALGAVSESGDVYINQEVAGYAGADKFYIRHEQEVQAKEIKRRAEMFRRARPKIPLEGKVVILTDDGIATGATMQAALWSLRREKPKTLIAAVPVAPPDSLNRLVGDADELLCLRAPSGFAAVGQFYENFRQVEDEEVLGLLSGTAMARKKG